MAVFLSLFGGVDAADSDAIQAKADALCRDQRVRDISYSKLKKFLIVECGFSGHEQGLFAASNKLALVKFAVRKGISLEPTLMESQTHRSTVRERQQQALHENKKGYPVVFTLTPYKTAGDRLLHAAAERREASSPPAAGGSPLARLSQLAAEAAHALAEQWSRALPAAHDEETEAAARMLQIASMAFHHEVTKREAARARRHGDAVAWASMVHARYGGPLRFMSYAAWEPSAPRFVSYAATGAAAAATMADAEPGPETTSGLAPATSGELEVEVWWVTLALSVAAGGEVRATFGAHSGSGHDAQHARKRPPIRPPTPDHDSHISPALRQKAAEVRAILQIPDDVEFSVEEMAAMVPIEGSLDEKINALHAMALKRLGGAASAGATASGGELHSPAPPSPPNPPPALSKVPAATAVPLLHSEAPAARAPASTPAAPLSTEAPAPLAPSPAPSMASPPASPTPTPAPTPTPPAPSAPSAMVGSERLIQERMHAVRSARMRMEIRRMQSTPP